MSWTPLRDRLDHMPLILAGPVLRRTEPTAVTVWLVVRQACEVTVQVYSTQYGNGQTIDRFQFSGKRHTVAIGQYLHLVAVTAKATGVTSLQPDQIYAYDLQFQLTEHSHQHSPEFSAHPISFKQALNTPNAPSVPISYFDHGLPTFLLPPENINDLKLIHGSCRKTHGGGIDALPILDDLLEQSASLPQQRLHQLFFTGDQIYGDDVADPWLFSLTDAGDMLMGWQEVLPIEHHSSPTIPPLYAQHLPPGQRTNVAEKLAGFTAGLHHKPDSVNSHLLSFAEYCTAYLFTWSPVLWPHHFPDGNPHVRDRQQDRIWNQEATTLKVFFHSLWKVRRALANIPTYMIFDDHDISDDWYLNRTWCERVLGQPLGRRVVRNGLLAYALCQAWGNTPEQFEPGTVGDRLLQATQAWSSAQGKDTQAEETIDRLLGLPVCDAAGMPQFCQDESAWVLDRDADALRWHYTIRSACHEVLVLDTRTWRGYPMDADRMAPPMLMSPSAFDHQIRAVLCQSRDVETIVIAPTNLIHLRLIDWVQSWSLEQGQIFNHDVGDAWNLNKEALSELLASLFEFRDRVIVLSGDIHYGFAAKLNYWPHAVQEKEEAKVLVQLTSSAFKNADVRTQMIQTKLKSIAPEPPQEWVGWHQVPELWQAQWQWRWLWGRMRWTKLPPADRLPLILQHRSGWGNRPKNWTIAAGDLNSLPDWHYRIEWIKRQAARSIPWGRKLGWLQYGQRQQRQGRLRHWLSWLWRNRWVQEGHEVVGESNIGVVRFDHFGRSDQGLSDPVPIVFQDLYWCPPWQPDSIVMSPFVGQVQPDQEATPFPLLAHDLLKAHRQQSAFFQANK